MINRKGKEMEFGDGLEVGRGKEKMQVSCLRRFLFCFAYNFFFFFNLFYYLVLGQVFVVACRIFSCSVWDLVP